MIKTKEEKYICKKMIEDGLMANVIIPVLEDDGLVAHIGEYWFFFGGSEFEYTDPKKIPFTILVEKIKNALDGFYECSDYEDEYLYYFFYLQEHI